MYFLRFLNYRIGDLDYCLLETFQRTIQLDLPIYHKEVRTLLTTLVYCFSSFLLFNWTGTVFLRPSERRMFQSLTQFDPPPFSLSYYRLSIHEMGMSHLYLFPLSPPECTVE